MGGDDGYTSGGSNGNGRNSGSAPRMQQQQQRAQGSPLTALAASAASSPTVGSPSALPATLLDPTMNVRGKGLDLHLDIPDYHEGRCLWVLGGNTSSVPPPPPPALRS